MPGKGLLERLAEGVVIGDGGYVTILEKRGYCRIGVWTPEATVEHPEAGLWYLLQGNTSVYYNSLLNQVRFGEFPWMECRNSGYFLPLGW